MDEATLLQIILSLTGFLVLAVIFGIGLACKAISNHDAKLSGLSRDLNRVMGKLGMDGKG